ncbi:hypothetical protein [Micromonospora carbonacea]|uniref:Uncharacterized protein n=1 Tax=Micromonospora carbonacea TaxID=47853 RepID=A0A7H8XK68_9ACTN|nr:hypothetical protein [Micromonospora carbonacea]MBB5826929.1 cbb3-type cytochrome oxidase subunit 3 [Micromonospora carbonacea]QLD25235.1 hypothetical protein HXZ27_14285 [Micromonospora carbonacea]
MRWLIILIIVLAVAAAVWLWRRSRRASIDASGQLLDQQASTEARRRLDEHRNRSDGSGTGSGGVGGWSL